MSFLVEAYKEVLPQQLVPIWSLFILCSTIFIHIIAIHDFALIFFTYLF